MFTAEVADLACLWELGVAGGCLAADEGVEVGKGAGAVSVVGYGSGVDVIHYEEKKISSRTHGAEEGKDVGKRTERSTARRQIRELDFKLNTDAVVHGGSSYGTDDISTGVGGVEELFVGEGGCVEYAGWVVLDDGSIALGTGDWVGGGLRGNEAKKASEADGEDRGVHLEGRL